MTVKKKASVIKMQSPAIIKARNAMLTGHVKSFTKMMQSELKKFGLKKGDVEIVVHFQIKG